MGIPTVPFLGWHGTRTHQDDLEVVLDDDGGSAVVDAVPPVLPHQLLLLRLEELPGNTIWLTAACQRSTSHGSNYREKGKRSDFKQLSASTSMCGMNYHQLVHCINCQLDPKQSNHHHIAIIINLISEASPTASSILGNITLLWKSRTSSMFPSICRTLSKKSLQIMLSMEFTKKNCKRYNGPPRHWVLWLIQDL